MAHAASRTCGDDRIRAGTRSRSGAAWCASCHAGCSAQSAGGSPPARTATCPPRLASLVCHRLHSSAHAWTWLTFDLGWCKKGKALLYMQYVLPTPYSRDGPVLVASQKKVQRGKGLLACGNQDRGGTHQTGYQVPVHSPLTCRRDPLSTGCCSAQPATAPLHRHPDQAALLLADISSLCEV